jgi:hypothetical protein
VQTVIVRDIQQEIRNLARSPILGAPTCKMFPQKHSGVAGGAQTSCAEWAEHRTVMRTVPTSFLHAFL